MSASAAGVPLPPSPGEAAALAHPSRRRVAEALCARPSGATAFQLAEAVGLHHNAVRQHLEVLARAGLVTSAREQVPGRRGRPSIRYRLVAPGGLAEAGHGELVRLLLRIVRRAGASEQEMEDLGREEGRLLAGAGSGGEGLVEALARLGFAPEDVTAAADRGRGDMDLRLRRCPFADAVLAEGGHLVCALHRGLTLGFLDMAAADGYLSAFEPHDPLVAGCRVAARGVRGAE